VLSGGMELTIRPCTAADAEALALVGQASFLETYADVLPGPDILAHCERQHARERYAAWLAHADYRLWLAQAPGGAPVGYALVGPSDLPVETGAGDLELKRIYLLSRFHGAGAGARLLQAAVDQARSAGATRLWLGVFSRNTRAIAFYARQGFVQAGVRKFQVGANTYDDLVLALRL
jgi:diamine N-acetyltransferase